MEIRAGNSKITIVLTVGESGEVRFAYFGGSDACGKSPWQSGGIIQLQTSGENWNMHHNNKYVGTFAADKMRYAAHKKYVNPYGEKLEVTLSSGNLKATVHYQFFGELATLRSWTEVKNCSNEEVGLEFVSSFFYKGLSRAESGCVHVPHNTWAGELQWRKYTADQLGLDDCADTGLKRIAYTSNGTWSSGEYLPMGMYGEEGNLYYWQIENNGAWYWEISDLERALYLCLSGPTERENHWHKNLAPSQEFTTVPVSVGVSHSFENAAAELTRYRRRIRRKNEDNEALPVIFNDYMNCLFGDATTEKLLPLIDAAAQAGCEYFCIDAGWYADGEWWDGVGEWVPSQRRFPCGLSEVTEYIREKGMKLGLWLEIEVMGIASPMLEYTEADWFFTRHGKKVVDHGRYQLDFRNPRVREFADEVIHRLVCGYGAEYIKMDYNINGGVGTEIKSDSFGDGLLEHNRAYLAWLDGIFAKYPQLVIENCGSGGLRMDYAMLSRCSIQSTSDQTDYKRYALIAANAATACCPEQAAVWSYPLAGGDAEETIFNMVNGLLSRIHQSGHLATLSRERFELVREGIALYKTIRGEIKTGVPFYPTGIAEEYRPPYVTYGIRCKNRTFLAVWQLNSEVPVRVPIHGIGAVQIYPARYPIPAELKNGSLSLSMKPYTARLFEIEEARR